MGVHKTFDKGNYESNDWVKFKVARKLNEMGYFTIVVEDFGVDIRTYHPIKGYQDHEVEHRPVWEGSRFPFKSIHIPERKTRLLGKNDLFYWVVNKENDTALVCDAKSCMIKSNLIVLPNKSIADGEEFYDIPIINFKYIKL